MKSKIVLFLFLLVLVFGCTKKPIIATEKSFTQAQLESCKTVECPEISVDYIHYSGREEVADSINNHINKFIIQTLYLGDPVETPKAVSIEEAALSFNKMYWTHNAEFPDLTIDYFAEITITESLKTKDFISISLGSYMFTGGAHGYGSTNYYNVDVETGTPLSIKNLFTNEEELKIIAERHFRDQFKIPKDAPINSTYFWFENDSYHLPESIGFTTEYLVLHYNQYEIASYADGPIIVEIPIEKVAHLIKMNTDSL